MRKRLPTPRGIDNLSTIIYGVLHGFYCVGGVYFEVIFGFDLQGHQLDIPADAADTHIVVADGSDDPRYMCAVIKIVNWVIVPIIQFI